MKIKNFTPLFDQLTQQTDLFTAAVYGRVWRYEQGDYKKCSAAVKTIARELGISEKTVERKLIVLVDMGLIKDLTPDRRNAPHDYITTGLVDIIIDGTSESLTSKKTGATKSRSTQTQSHTGTSESRSQTVRESVEETIKKEETIEIEEKISLFPEQEKWLDGLKFQLSLDKLAYTASRKMENTHISDYSKNGDGIYLKIACQTDEQRDWLNGRMINTARRMLTGFFDEEVKLEFVTEANK